MVVKITKEMVEDLAMRLARHRDAAPPVPCRKKPYLTEKAALDELDRARQLLAKGFERRQERRAYACERCDKWHLTSAELEK